MTDSFEDHCWKDVVSPEILEVYSCYQRETFVGPNPALLAIDLYEVVYRGGALPPHRARQDFANSCGRYAHEAIEPTRQLFAAARAAGLPVFYSTGDTREASKPKFVSATKRNRPVFDPTDYDIRPEFKPQPGDVVITKQRASAFYGTPLLAHLTQLGVQTSSCAARAHRVACARAWSTPIPAAFMSCWSRNAVSIAASSRTRSTCSTCITNTPT